MSNLLKVIILMAWWLPAAAALAESATPADSPYTLVKSTSAQVLAAVVLAEEYVDDDPERYYGQVQVILDPLLDYRGFARKVMGPYASSKRYRSLDEPGRVQLRGQLDEFTQVMRRSLIRTYSKGLLAFGGARIVVEEPDSGSEDQSVVSIHQLIYADNPLPYEVIYQMGLVKSGDWKLRNVIIESVNLGEIYRDQFLASAREFDGNLDAVIGSWTSVTVEVEK